MSEVMNIDIEKAAQDPESVFTTPTEIVDHVGLTRGQKNATLESWAFTLRARIDAVSEGMTNYPEGAYTRDVEWLRQVEKGIETLRCPAPDADSRQQGGPLVPRAQPVGH